MYAVSNQGDKAQVHQTTQTTQNYIMETQTSQTEKVYVYVCGCVNAPGVYAAGTSSRVYELIEMAGGFSEEADGSALNLADTVKDGQKILVPSLNSSDEQSLSAGSGLVNLNTADKQQLMTLPGIGESKADSIIAYRNNNGAFNNIEEIKNISGIKDAAYEKIKDLICV
jgi:competence protein ComEA